MNLWTNGSTHAHLYLGRFRLWGEDHEMREDWLETSRYAMNRSFDLHLEDDLLVLSMPGRQPKTRLYRLSDLELLAEHEGILDRAVAIGGGELLGISGNQLVRGIPGQPWASEETLKFEGGLRVAGLCDTPGGDEIHRSPGLTVNEHGTVVYDETTGVVAVRRPASDHFERPWFVNAEQQANLYAEATSKGVLVVGRWAMRYSIVWHLHGEQIDVLHEGGNGTYAHSVGECVLLYTTEGWGNNVVIAVDRATGKELGRTERIGGRGGPMSASAHYGSTLLLGFDKGLMKVTWDGGSFQQELL